MIVPNLRLGASVGGDTWVVTGYDVPAMTVTAPTKDGWAGGIHPGDSCLADAPVPTSHDDMLPRPRRKQWPEHTKKKHRTSPELRRMQRLSRRINRQKGKRK